VLFLVGPTRILIPKRLSTNPEFRVNLPGIPEVRTETPIASEFKSVLANLIYGVYVDSIHRRSPSLAPLLQPYCTQLPPGPPPQAQMRSRRRPPRQDTRVRTLVYQRYITDGPIPLAPRQF
jgi:hypothetical protein